MSYLARLKQLENEKNSHHVPDTELTKPTKPPFGSFGGSHPAHIEKNLSDEAVPTVKAVDLIYTLQLGGFEFSLIDDRLSIEPYEKLTIGTKKLINQNDSAIIAELRRI